jgi:hypothetical protein
MIGSKQFLFYLKRPQVSPLCIFLFALGRANVNLEAIARYRLRDAEIRLALEAWGSWFANEWFSALQLMLIEAGRLLAPVGRAAPSTTHFP